MSKVKVYPRNHEILNIYSNINLSSFNKPYYNSQRLNTEDLESEKEFYLNEIPGRATINTSPDLGIELRKILTAIQNSLNPVETFHNFLLDNLLNNCCQLFITNVPSLKDEINLKGSILYLITDYIINNDIEKIEVNDLVNLATQIFDNQIIPFISSLVIEVIEDRIKFTAREQEYLNTHGVDLDLNNVLNKAQSYIQENNKDSYAQNILLSTNGEYKLPVIKCLMLFEPEHIFIERLENPVLQEFFTEYRDHIDRTVLHYAAAKGKVEIVKSLCQIMNTKKLIDSVDGYGRTALHLASSEGYSKIIEELVNNGANLHIKDGYGRTALHLAAINNQVEVIQQLKDLNIELDVKDNFGRTPLHLAALFNNIDAINKLIEFGANSDERDGYGRIPLHLAASNDNAEAVAKLLAVTTELSVNDELYRTPLHLAVRKDALNSVKEFWKYGVRRNENNTSKDTVDTVVHLAAKYNSINILKFLCSNKALNINAQNTHGSTPLHHAAFNGNTEAIRILLASGADITVQDSDKGKRIPLYLTMQLNKDLIKFLGAEEASARKVQAATICIDYDYSEFVENVWGKSYKFCNTSGMDPGGFKSNQKNPLKDYYYNAAKGGFLDSEVGNFVLRVCNFFNNLHYKDNTTILPLPYDKQDHIPLIIKVAKSKNIDLLKELIEKLPEFAYTLDDTQKNSLLNEIKDNIEMAALLETFYLFKSAEEGDIKLIDTLLKHNNFINEKNEEERTLLHIAADRNNSELVKLLLEKNAEVDPQDDFSITPLQLATLRNNKAIVELLLQKDANPNIPGAAGITAMHIAAENGNIDILKLLYAKEGNLNVLNNNKSSLLHSTSNGILKGKDECWELLEWLLDPKHDLDPFIENDRKQSPRDVLEHYSIYYADKYDEVLQVLGYYEDYE